MLIVDILCARPLYTRARALSRYWGVWFHRKKNLATTAHKIISVILNDMRAYICQLTYIIIETFIDAYMLSETCETYWRFIFILFKWLSIEKSKINTLKCPRIVTQTKVAYTAHTKYVINQNIIFSNQMIFIFNSHQPLKVYLYWFIFGFSRLLKIANSMQDIQFIYTSICISLVIAKNYF